MNSRTQKEESRNRVLAPDFRQSRNFYQSDLILRGYLCKYLSPHATGFMETRLHQLGSLAAGPMNAMSMNADKYGPVLHKRNAYGETIDEVRFHPDYQSLMAIAVESGMFQVKWEPNLREQMAGSRHAAGFAAGFVYAMSESGQYCPLCMTDGAALLIDHHGQESDWQNIIPKIASTNPKEFVTGAMFLTEKAGGSDVGANIVEARQIQGRRYALFGEKWFCSNVNAEVILVLARTNPEIKGTKGLSIFLVQSRKHNGERNPLGIVRLKDKLGVRSMASGECLLDGTEATLLGEEFHGFRIMTEMINLSRLYNSVAAISGGRRALIEAWQFLSFRDVFGKNALHHALVRVKFWELGALHLANFHLVWRAIRALDAAELGDAEAVELLRLLTPMAKRSSAEAAVYLARESMELMGGMGYIEDTVVPKVMRDMMVLPIWEGAGNIMVLDMLRAAQKSHGLALMAAEVQVLTEGKAFSKEIRSLCGRALGILADATTMEQSAFEWQAKQAFLNLTLAYQCALIASEETPARAHTALSWLLNATTFPHPTTVPPSINEVTDLIGWEF